MLRLLREAVRRAIRGGTVMISRLELGDMRTQSLRGSLLATKRRTITLPLFSKLLRTNSPSSSAGRLLDLRAVHRPQLHKRSMALPNLLVMDSRALMALRHFHLGLVGQVQLMRTATARHRLQFYESHDKDDTSRWIRISPTTQR